MSASVSVTNPPQVTTAAQTTEMSASVGVTNPPPVSRDTEGGCNPAVTGGLAGVAAASVVMNVVMVAIIVLLSLLLAKKTNELKANVTNPAPSRDQHQDVQNQAYIKTSNIPLRNNECYGIVPASPIEGRVEHPFPQQVIEDYDYDVN